MRSKNLGFLFVLGVGVRCYNFVGYDGIVFDSWRYCLFDVEFQVCLGGLLGVLVG